VERQEERVVRPSGRPTSSGGCTSDPIAFDEQERVWACIQGQMEQSDPFKTVESDPVGNFYTAAINDDGKPPLLVLPTERCSILTLIVAARPAKHSY
jgi:hypothetical protein